MNTQMRFSASARHEMTAQPPFRVGGYELHVFRTPSAITKRASADDVRFSSVGPALGAGLEYDDVSLFKGPEDRANDARYTAEHSGHAVCIVAYDLDTDVQPITLNTSSTPETKIFRLGAYEAHVHYPAGCTHRNLSVENLNIQEAGGTIGMDDYEMNNTLNANERAVRAHMTLDAMKKDGAAKAVAFFVGRENLDETLEGMDLALLVNRAAGTQTLEDMLATSVNTQLRAKAAPASWLRRVLGISTKIV